VINWNAGPRFSIKPIVEQTSGNFDYTVSSIAWLENDVFFVTYTPNVPEDDSGMNPASSL
jgi:hypothetical protein